METGDAAEADFWTSGIVVGDFNRDGRLELMLTSGDSEDAKIRYLELNKPGSHHWLRVLPLSRSGAPARGADVTITQGTAEEGEHIQRRIIDGGSGYGAQQEPVAHFGLGDDDRSPVVVTVRWADGAVSVDKIDIDTMVVFDHPGFGVEIDNAQPVAPPPSPKPTPKNLPKKGGSAALLGAMMGHKKKKKPVSETPPSPPSADVAASPTLSTATPPPATGASAKPAAMGSDEKAERKVDTGKPKKKGAGLPSGLAKMLRRL